MHAAISIKNLTKYYGRSKVAAVNKLTLSLEPGEVYGFLGANGAGKSTTIRLILDFIRPTSGSITVLGKDSFQESVAVKKEVGYLSGDVALPKGVTGRQLLDYLIDLQGGITTSYFQELEKRFQAQLDKKIESLSKGNRQKIGLIAAFMGKPKVLILDEPTSGLDPLMQEQFYKTILEAKAAGSAVFLSSHSFNEVERICDRVGIIRDGKLVYEGTIANVISQRLPSWHVTVAQHEDLEELKHSDAITIKSELGLSVTVNPTDSIAKALATLAKVQVTSLSSAQDDLESEFMSFYNKQEGA